MLILFLPISYTLNFVTRKQFSCVILNIPGGEKFESVNLPSKCGPEQH